MIEGTSLSLELEALGQGLVWARKVVPVGSIESVHGQHKCAVLVVQRGGPHLGTPQVFSHVCRH
jgi:hypothetical protein